MRRVVVSASSSVKHVQGSVSKKPDVKKKAAEIIDRLRLSDSQSVEDQLAALRAAVIEFAFLFCQ